MAAGTPEDLAGSGIATVTIATLVAIVISRIVAENNRGRAELQSQERWRAAMVATLAHDVRAPLTSIMGALEILTDDHPSPAESRPLLEGATRQAARILRLAAGLLEVERVDQGHLTLDRRDVPLLDLLQDIAATHHQIPMVIDVPTQLRVWADRERLEQVLVNLINISSHHGAPPLVVSAELSGTGVEISIRDHGPGVPEAEVPHLFERFSSSDHAPQSVGLGLWVVRLLTEAHDGTVRYEYADPGPGPS